MPRGEHDITQKDLAELEEHIAATTNRAFTGVQKQIDASRRLMVTKTDLRTGLRGMERRIISAIKLHTPKIDVEKELELVKERLTNLEQAIGVAGR